MSTEKNLIYSQAQKKRCVHEIGNYLYFVAPNAYSEPYCSLVLNSPIEISDPPELKLAKRIEANKQSQEALLKDPYSANPSLATTSPYEWNKTEFNIESRY